MLRVLVSPDAGNDWNETPPDEGNKAGSSIVRRVLVEGVVYVVKLPSGQHGEKRFGPANELVGDSLLRLVGAANRPASALIEFRDIATEVLLRAGAVGSVGYARALVDAKEVWGNGIT